MIITNVDDFLNSENRFEKFKDALLVTHGKDDKDSFSYTIRYAIC